MVIENTNIMLKKFNYMRISLLLTVILISAVSEAQNISKMPKTEILGKEYYIYEVKKGESVYGIAKRYNWDIEELVRLNPDASASVKKGDRLYYPTGQVTLVTEMPEIVEIDYSSLEPVKHKVKKGETVYSISRQYNVPLDIIYKNNPNSRKGVKPGEIVVLPQNGTAQYYYYTVKRGDTLSSISQKFNTSVEDILRDNPGITAGNLQEGETLRITLNSNAGKVKTELVAEERVSKISGYKVSKNESWKEISDKTGVEEEVLKDANSTTDKPKENSIINVPLIETVEVEKTVNYSESPDISEDRVQELYDSIKGNPIDSDLLTGVKIALILDEPASKKDIDFTRGMLTGLAEFKDVEYSIEFKVMDGRVSTTDLINELDNFEPNVIFSTADKAFPLFLADYGNTNNIQIINVFDLKNDLYEDNASIVQILPPSGYFNDRISTKIYKDNNRRHLIVVGEEDETDGLVVELMSLFDGEGESLTLEEFGTYEADPLQPLLIYSYAVKKEEVDDFMKNVENLSENHPSLDFRIIGRSNWITMTDDFGDQFGMYNVYIPSRVWIDEDSEQWHEFNKKYEALFGGNPVRSIPNFAVGGYDMSCYFIPLVAENKGDFNKGLQSEEFEALQNNIELTRVNNWGGFINSNSYLIRFHPDGVREKIVVQ